MGVYQFTNLDMIEGVHLKFCKLLLHLKKSTPNFMVYGELGVYPMSVHIKLRMVNYWSRIVNGKENKMSLILYKFMFLKYSQNDYRSEWLNFVKNILDKCGYGYIWLLQSNFNTKLLSINLKQKLFDQFQQNWHSDISNSTKGLSYSLFKEKFEFEKYLDILCDKDRSIFCKFRTVNHRLPIETGRWFGIDRQIRYCNLCQTQELGDEFHYLLSCRFFADSRKQFLDKYFWNGVNVIKFSKLLQTTNRSKLKNICKFIKTINSLAGLPG